MSSGPATDKDRFKAFINELLDTEQLIPADLLRLIGERQQNAALKGRAEATLAYFQENHDDDVEIDELPMYAEGEDGVWVSAWLWMSNPEPEEDDGPDPTSTG